jgi:hypothetical protein
MNILAPLAFTLRGKGFADKALWQLKWLKFREGEAGLMHNSL